MSSIQRLRQDLGYAWRGLLGAPLFTAIAIAALGIGIGANTTLFSMVDAFMLHPFGVDESGWVFACEKPPNLDFFPTSQPMLSEWKGRSQTFESLAAISLIEFNLMERGESARIFGTRVSPEFFETLQMRPLHGRLFTREESENPNARVILLSHSLWEKQFQKAPDILDRGLILNNTRYTVVGIAPEGMRFPHGAQFWLPYVPTAADSGDRELRNIFGLGRLRPGVDTSAAEAELSRLMKRAQEENPQLDLYSQARVVPTSYVLINSRKRMTLMMAAAFFVLLIACANIANMLLARASQREREIAIRAALGATRMRIVRQLLTESFLLAFISGVLGLVIALWATDALRSIYPPGASQYLPAFDEIRVTPRVIGFGFILCCMTALEFGLVPALRLSSVNLQEVLQREAKSLTPGRATHRFRNALVVAETALALMLVVAALLTARSFRRLAKEGAVFRPQTMLAAVVSSPPNEKTYPSDVRRYVTEALARLGKLDGVESVAITTLLPLAYNFSDFSLEVDGQSARPETQLRVSVNLISPNLFETVGVQPMRGRGFVSQDEGSERRVAVVSESFAGRFWPNQSAVGHRIRINPGHSPSWAEIIGVVPNIRYRVSSKESEETVYLPLFDQDWQTLFRRMGCELGFFMRTTRPMEPLIKVVRSELVAIDPTQTVSEVAPLSMVLDEWALSAYRAVSLVTGILALVALFLAAIGIYGVVSYTVSLRTQEIGIRLALGAPSRSVLRWIIWQGMLPCLVGLAIGTGVSLFSSRVLGNMLFGYSPYDIPTSLLVTTVLTFVALGACFIPARAALRIDPAIAMRAN
ncbi:MAG TPA: ABC transporter permease [Myxococcaceae bacterium]|nr:ABC transporter permease [Myxococcaceae bacterium]